jgi:uncharacterized protein YjbI with pentapeptide repeats
VNHANLTNAILIDASFALSELKNADLTGADLTSANLAFADLTDAILLSANMTNVTWSNTICPDGTYSDHNGNTCVNNT